MKRIYKISFAAVIASGALNYSPATAQEFKTDESIAAQLINGTAPGLKFGPKAVKKESIKMDMSKYSKDIGESLFTDYSKYQGSNPKAAVKTLNATTLKQSAKANASLPSDTKAPEPDKKKFETPKLPPMQSEEKETN